MKNILFLIFITATALFANAQENVKVCDENQTAFEQFIIENKFDEAQKIFSLISKNCPSANSLALNTLQAHAHTSCRPLRN